MRYLLVGFLFCCIAAQAQVPLSDAAFSKSFRCPEDLPTDQARQDAIYNFLAWVQQRYPGLTIAKIAEIRTRFLEEHHCEKTLANIRSSAVISDKKSPRNLCTADDGKRYFSNEPAQNCIPVPLEHGWKSFRSGPAFVMDILPSKVVRERDGTKVWAQFFLAEAVPSDDGKWSYDHVKSVTKFFCGTKQQLLIQGTYSLNGRRIYERSSTESVMEEIEPDTLAEDLYHYACRR
jgi:hypothetical protein